jgi:hypothetical protein
MHPSQNDAAVVSRHKESPMKRFVLTVAAAAAMLAGTAAHAGPFILAGTDADDHGFVSGTNQQGWLFMQRALENIGAAVTNGNKVVTILGSTGSAQAAASSAFNLSSLVGAGWTLQVVSQASFGTFFGGGAGNVDDAGILMMDSGFNVGGGVDGSAYTAFSTIIDNFLGAGGGLFSQANGYQWLSTLVPGLTVVNEADQGLELTAAGNTAFPGLTNADLSSGPWHSSFANTGAIPILATSNSVGSSTFGHAVIIGGATGSITNPGVPEPASLALVGIALAAAGAAAKRKRA